MHLEIGIFFSRCSLKGYLCVWPVLYCLGIPLCRCAIWLVAAQHCNGQLTVGLLC